MLNLTYEYKIQPNFQQEQTMLKWLEQCRRVYNYALREHKDWLKSRKCAVNACSLKQEYIMSPDAPRPNYYSQCKSLAAVKVSIPELKEPHTHVLQQSLHTLDKAFVSMWEKGFGFPRFKKRMRSFLFPQMGVNPIKGKWLKLPKIGTVKMRLSRPIPDGFELKQVRIVKRVSGWFAMLSLQADIDVPAVLPHGNPVGIDLGLVSFAATSKGELIARPKFFVDAQGKLKSLQRKLKHKNKGSSNWHKCQRKVVQLHLYINNARKDFHFKVAHHLCNSAGMVFAEDLNLKAMSKGMLCKHTLDAGFGQFLNILKWVCFKRDVYFQKVDANGTSQTCPQCNTHVPKDLSVRVHICPVCNFQTDRDVAAAQVVRQRGGLGGLPHERLPVLQRGISAVGHTVVKLAEATS